MTRQLPWSQFNDYQLMAESYDVGAALCDKRLVHALGLVGEAGEAVEHIKKSFRDGTPIDLGELMLELGDCQWYLTMVARGFGIAHSDLIDANLRKLADRRRRNVLAGRGDHR